jgi:hypothetical protein
MLSVTVPHRTVLTCVRTSDGSDSSAPKTPAPKKAKAKGTGYVAVSKHAHTRTYTD